MSSRGKYLLGAALAVGIGAAGCAEPAQSSHVNMPAPNGNAEYVVKFPEEKPGLVRGIGIDLGPDTAMECRDLKPKFFFDESKPTPQDQAQLKGLAACLARPGMEKTEILLVGRADATGSNDYNDKLGFERATAVKKLLVKEGVPDQRIRIVSAGEEGAKGNTMAFSEGFDRRVDIHVTGNVHAP